MDTTIRDTAPENTIEERPRFALLFVAATAGHARRADRALAHAIRAAQHAGIDQDAVIAATGLGWGQVMECLDRWAGDQS